MKSKQKAKLITVLVCVLLIVMFADMVALWPWTLPWILGVFAVPGAFKFAKTLYIWLIIDEPVLDEIHWPFRKKQPKTYEYYAEGGR